MKNKGNKWVKGKRISPCWVSSSGNIRQKFKGTDDFGWTSGCTLHDQQGEQEKEQRKTIIMMLKAMTMLKQQDFLWRFRHPGQSYKNDLIRVTWKDTVLDIRTLRVKFHWHWTWITILFYYDLLYYIFIVGMLRAVMSFTDSFTISNLWLRTGLLPFTLASTGLILANKLDTSIY